MKPFIPELNITNKCELKFYNLLSYRKIAKEIVDFRYKPYRINLVLSIKGGHRSVTYEPDFLIIHKEYFEYVDTKAKGKVKTKIDKTGKIKKSQWTSMEDDARVKINIASELFPWYKWTVYYLMPDKTWLKEDVNIF